MLVIQLLAADPYGISLVERCELHTPGIVRHHVCFVQYILCGHFGVHVLLASTSGTQCGLVEYVVMAGNSIIRCSCCSPGTVCIEVQTTIDGKWVERCFGIIRIRLAANDDAVFIRNEIDLSASAFGLKNQSSASFGAFEPNTAVLIGRKVVTRTFNADGNIGIKCRSVDGDTGLGRIVVNVIKGKYVLDVVVLDSTGSQVGVGDSALVVGINNRRTE